MTHKTKDARALVERLYTHGCYWAVGDTASENRARDCDLAADALTAALDRAEKAEAVDDSLMDTAHITGHKKGWNDAIDAAAKYHDNFLMTKTNLIVEEVVSSTEAILELKKGDDQ